MVEHDGLQLTCVRDHRDIEGNKTADQLARLGSECLFVGPEPACDISAVVCQESYQELDKKRSQEGLGVLNRTQTCNEFPTRTLCQKKKLRNYYN
jgi:hypothetical protein